MPAWSRSLARYLLLTAVWIVLWRLSVLMEVAPHASLWYPPAGLSFAAFLVLGWRALPAIISSVVIVTFWMNDIHQEPIILPDHIATGLLQALLHAGSYFGGAWLLRFIVERLAPHQLPQTIVAFFFTALVASLAASLLGPWGLYLSGVISHSDIDAIWLSWAAGDFAATLIMTPLFIGLLSWRYPDIQHYLGGLHFQLSQLGSQWYLLKLALVLILLSAVMLISSYYHTPKMSLLVFFLSVPMMWIVYTERPYLAAIALAITSTAVALWVGTLGLLSYALTYQVAMCLIAINAYFGMALPALREQNDALRLANTNDALTGVLTRSYFLEQAQQAAMSCAQRQQPCSLLMFDLDGFKQLNDNYGHDMGDRALKIAAQEVSKRLRSNDFVGRFGGDEFMVCCHNTNLDQAKETAERLRTVLTTTKVQANMASLHASFGVVELAPQETIHKALQRADSALLEAKRRGKNCVYASAE